ncbi:MAG TPA: alpha/beta hydrolase, partial [Ilumatobacteraceae bacterium]
NLSSEFDQLMDRLAAEPAVMPANDPATGEPFVLTETDLAMGVHSALLQHDYFGWLPGGIHAAYEKDWGTFVQLAQSMNAGSGANEELAMKWVIQCSESWARFDPAATKRNGAGSYLVDAEVAIAEQQGAVCAALPHGVVEANDGEAVASDVPVLLLVGEADPQNPPSNTADASRDLPNSRRVVVPGEGHGVAQLGCLPGVVTAFIEAGTADGLDVSCVQSMDPPRFQI